MTNNGEKEQEVTMTSQNFVLDSKEDDSTSYRIERRRRHSLRRRSRSDIFLSFCFFVSADVITTALSPSAPLISRRLWLIQQIGTTSFLISDNNNQKKDELPSVLRGISLAPLGKPQTSSDKSTNLSLEEISNRLTKDLTVGANGMGGYFITGDLSSDIFKDDCIFSDPTNQVKSLSQYQNALRILFDPTVSQVQLLSPLTINENTNTISGRLRSRGYLQLPWRPYVSAYETDIVYTVDPETGLISRQDQVWDSKSASKALKETFTPSLIDPTPPMSKRLQPPPNEPQDVTKLFTYINGRRPNEYTPQERMEISELIDSVVSTSPQTEFQRDLLPGKWILAYLQPGPDGAGIDRRIPFFPEFDFNDNFQIFGSDDASITNIGQVLGQWAFVEVSGTLKERDSTSLQVPKKFQANIQQGKLCILQNDKCIALPISGEGIFESLYLGERLRIGQNINGGGARVVQIRLD